MLDGELGLWVMEVSVSPPSPPSSLLSFELKLNFYDDFPAVSMPMMTSLLTLKKAGIVNTATGAGSNRWQNSGGFAVNSKGIVTFVKIAEHAGDMVDYEVAVKSLGL